ncbi:MAG: Tfp pilus assembly protein pilus retraction ATPase PilT [Acidimicrobiales bacterium]|jgi:twitching motility protein PilT|nr:Tfp pilus assembly protein pilus retraction ATPase PilT [Acidimicrobiales bacterium]
MLDFNELLAHVVEVRGSDLHIKVGSAPHVRVDGRLEVAPFDAATPADTERIAFALMPKERAEEFMARSDADFAHSVSGVGRFRVNVYRQRGSIGLVLRRVMPGVPTIESLGLPTAVRRLAEEQHGLILVTGPTSSGKTSTAAAILDHVNTSRAATIVTIEDPIEVLHADKQSLIIQREVGTDTADYTDAMQRVLRQDPDVIFVSELRDADIAWSALTAAQTGHLVIATMPTVNATETIDRLIDFFPPFQHRQVRQTLAATLRGIVSQRLLERADGRGRVAAMEILVATSRVHDSLADPVAGDLEALMSEGEYHGMQTFDQSLFQLCKDGLVSMRDAAAAAIHPHDFQVAVQNAGLPSAY